MDSPKMYALVEGGKVVKVGYPEDPTGWTLVEDRSAAVGDGQCEGPASYRVDGNVVVRECAVMAKPATPLTLEERVAALEKQLAAK